MNVVLIWCACFAIYLLFAGEVSWHEVTTGIVLATLVTGWARIIRWTSQRSFIFSREPIRPLVRGLISLFPGSLAAGRVLLRVAAVGGPAGGPQLQPFDCGVPHAYELPASLGRYKIAIGVVVVGLTTALAWTLRRSPWPAFPRLRRVARQLTRGGLGLLPEIIVCAAAALLRADEAGRAGSDFRLDRHHLDRETQAQSDRTRRALAVLLASLAPDRFIINVDRQSDTVLLHRIVPSEREIDPLWLI